MAEAWLRLAKPELHEQSNFSTHSVYRFKKAFVTAEARIFNRAHALADGGSRLETSIEFEAKLPIRKPDRYDISASGALAFPAGSKELQSAAQTAAPLVLTDITMTSENVNRSETETWTQQTPVRFSRERSHQKAITLTLPDFLSGLVLPAPFATRALADSWSDQIHQYNGLLLAGKKLVGLRIRPASNLSGDGVALSVEFLKFEAIELGGSLENFDHLRWGSAQKLKAVYSRSQKVITLFELELPIFGALAMQKIET